MRGVGGKFPNRIFVICTRDQILFVWPSQGGSTEQGVWYSRGENGVLVGKTERKRLPTQRRRSSEPASSIKYGDFLD